MIQFITDSTSNLTKALIGSLPIEVVSLSVLIDEEVFIENETTNEAFYQKMKSARSFPKSAQPSLDRVFDAFESAVRAGKEVIGMFISSEMSGTYQSACMVKNQLLEIYPNAKIEVIDSLTNCMQLGLAVLEGARLSEEGMTFEQISQQMRTHVNRSRFVFLPETLDYLKKGGRMGGASALIGSLLQILPILTVKEGKTDVLQKVRTKKKAVEALVQIALSDIERCGLGAVVVHHIEALTEGKALAERLEEILGIKIPVVDIGPVIGTHVGPGAIGIAYDLKKDLL